MKKLFYVLILIVVTSCDSEKGITCFQEAGRIVQEDFPVEDFDRLIVWERIHLFVKQGNEHKVIVETGENLLNGIEVTVKDGLLELRNTNRCNLVRDYGITKMYITAPNITKIRSSTGLPVESIGTLSYPSLVLLSEDQDNEDEFHIDGDFILDINAQNLQIGANGLSNFYLSGNVENANIGLFDGDNRIEAENLIIQNLELFHRGTQKMIVNPQQSIRGQIVSIGDVIAKNRPPLVEVEELFEGRLIFE
ncbi:head GIN domain-containing protein [Patiriisocius hiemis]|uniref:Head GIN domain-containing protein n=1 Tax=Patiriisocius hiemis TaxID=3075604 RepID=A0ABU2YDQ5_9FLAO|nr:head GIN domain-containing protein [Constantimarinum sp. W242]MDT0555794.1 head GIN domain-containing protein [Constantimarinum sp. W242]